MDKYTNTDKNPDFPHWQEQQFCITKCSCVIPLSNKRLQKHSAICSNCAGEGNSMNKRLACFRVRTSSHPNDFSLVQIYDEALGDKNLFLNRCKFVLSLHITLKYMIEKRKCVELKIRQVENVRKKCKSKKSPFNELIVIIDHHLHKKNRHKKVGYNLESIKSICHYWIWCVILQGIAKPKNCFNKY